jgi:putative tryptophan/tyrosine transport system substrate-binding protein
MHNNLLAAASELTALPVDLIFAMGTPAAKSAVAATKTIPIVFSRIGDPVGAGLVPNLNRPGGNATGVTVLAPSASRYSRTSFRD